MNLPLDRFLSYGELTRAVRSLADSHPRWCRVSSLGTTPENRAIPLLTVTDEATGTDLGKPGYFVFANVHACELAGTNQALRLAERLLEEEQGRLLAEVVFYIVPRANPDGAEYALRTKGRIRSRLVRRGAANALVPADVDGDGRILTMRIRHPDGDMVPFPEDPRIMVKRPAGAAPEAAYFTYEEGIVERFDGTFPLQSGVRQVDFNRNWPVHWEPLPLSGPYPFSEPETKALGGFLLSHANIFAGIDFHCGSQAVFRPSSRNDRALDPADLRLMDGIGRRGAEAIGIDYMVDGYRRPGDEPLAGFGGNSTDFAYFELGLSFYIIELGNGFNHAGIRTADFLAAPPEKQWGEYLHDVLSMHDARQSPIAHPWKRFGHPQLGDVEIGGIEEGNAYYMFPPSAQPMYEKCADFVLTHARLHPALRLDGLMTEPAPGGRLRVKGTLTNTGSLDTDVMRIGRSDFRFPVTVTVSDPSGAEPAVWELPGLAAGESRDFSLAVADGAGRCRIRASHPRAGSALAEIQPSREGDRP